MAKNSHDGLASDHVAVLPAERDADPSLAVVNEPHAYGTSIASRCDVAGRGVDEYPDRDAGRHLPLAKFSRAVL